ncbi:hypothetical protein [Pseudomonas fluorescens]
MILLINMAAKKILAAVIALASLISGTCWMASASAQVDSIGASAKAAEMLIKYSALLNQSAAVAAMVAGVCIALALCLAD